MLQFRYEALDRNGATLTGSVDAASETEAARRLSAMGLTPYSLRPVRAGRMFSLQGKRASIRELQLVLQEFTALLEAGVGLVTSLSSLAKSSHHPELTGAFVSMEKAVRRGESFSTALRESGLPVPEYIHQLMHAGEATGRMAEAMRGGLRQFEYDQRVRKEMAGAMIYPAVLVLSGVAAVGIIFLWVVPRFGGLLTQHGADMPALSRWVISTGVWLSAHVGWVLAALVGAGVAIRAVYAMPGVKEKLAEFLIRLPVIGDWVLEAEVGRWASTLSALLEGKVELVRALGLAAASVLFHFLRNRLSAVVKGVKGGMTLSAALREHRALNPTGYDLVAVGEASGELPKLLSALAGLYETTGRDRMKRLLQLVEPLAIIVIGAVVGVIMTAIILAITSVNDVPL